MAMARGRRLCHVGTLGQGLCHEDGLPLCEDWTVVNGDGFIRVMVHRPAAIVDRDCCLAGRLVCMAATPPGYRKRL